MFKRALILILGVILLLNSDKVSASSPGWQVSVEQNSGSLFKKYASSLQYLINDNQNQVFSISYFSYPQVEKLPSFLKDLASTSMEFRLGKSNLNFDWDYGSEHEISNMSDNLFLGYGAGINFKWEENWGASLMAEIDYGKIVNKSINQISGRQGYAYGRKANGAWGYVLADMAASYEQGNHIYFAGISVPSAQYSITYSDFTGYPSTYEVSDSFSSIQTYLYAGVRFSFLEKFKLSSKIEYPLGKASGLGYLVNLDYEF